MEQEYKKNSYEEAFYGFQERGLYLDTPREEFNHPEKSDCKKENAKVKVKLQCPNKSH